MARSLLAWTDRTAATPPWRSPSTKPRSAVPRWSPWCRPGTNGSGSPAGRSCWMLATAPTKRRCWPSSWPGRHEKYPDVAVRRVLFKGHPAEAMLRFGDREQHPSVLVVGSKGRAGSPVRRRARPVRPCSRTRPVPSSWSGTAPTETCSASATSGVASTDTDCPPDAVRRRAQRHHGCTGDERAGRHQTTATRNR